MEPNYTSDALQLISLLALVLQTLVLHPPIHNTWPIYKSLIKMHYPQVQAEMPQEIRNTFLRCNLRIFKEEHLE